MSYIQPLAMLPMIILSKCSVQDNHFNKLFLFRGYMAPEYALYGHLTVKADIYSFGVVALEIACGKNNFSWKPENECVNLLDRVRDLDMNFCCHYCILILVISVKLLH